MTHPWKPIKSTWFAFEVMNRHHITKQPVLDHTLTCHLLLSECTPKQYGVSKNTVFTWKDWSLDDRIEVEDTNSSPNSIPRLRCIFEFRELRGLRHCLAGIQRLNTKPLLMTNGINEYFSGWPLVIIDRSHQELSSAASVANSILGRMQSTCFSESSAN